jgi:hypothetical protein
VSNRDPHFAGITIRLIVEISGIGAHSHPVIAEEE